MSDTEEDVSVLIVTVTCLNGLRMTTNCSNASMSVL